MFSRAAILAGTIADARIDDDKVARPYVRHPVTGLFDDAAAIGAQNPRRRDGDAGQPFYLEKVEMIDCCGPDADEYVGGCGERWFGEVVAEFDLIETAVRRDRECSHAPRAQGYIPRGMLCHP